MNIPTQKYVQDLRKYYRLPLVQVSLTVVLSLFVVAIFITFALRPTLTSIVGLKKTIEKSRETLALLNTKVASLQRASSQLEQLTPYMDKINGAIPNIGAAYTPLTIAIEGTASLSGSNLDSETLGPTILYSKILSPFSPSKSQKVISMPYGLRVTGNYQSVVTFLNNILKMERLLSVENVSIAHEVGAKIAANTISLSITGNVFYLADQNQLDKLLQEIAGAK